MRLGLLILLLTLSGVLSIVAFVILYIRKSLTTEGVFQVYWTTNKSGIDFHYHKGLFRVKAANRENAEKMAIKHLQKKYQTKQWFETIMFAVRGGNEPQFSDNSRWMSIKTVIK